MRKIFAGLALMSLLIMAVTSVSAQEKVSVAESLKWLPDGAYDSFGNYNLAEMEKQPSYDFFKMLMNEDNGSLLGEAPPLPKSFEKSIEYISYAKSKKVGSEEELQALQGEMREKTRAFEVKARAAKKNKKGKVKFSKKDLEELDAISDKMKGIESTITLWSYKINNLQALMKKEVKSGNFARIGKRLYKKPVYAFNQGIAKGKATSDSKIFVFASDTGELLLCKDYEFLKAMVNSGYGAASNIFDNQEYAVCVNYLENRGQAWKVEPQRYVAVKELEKRHSSGIENSKIQAAEERIETRPVFKISNIILSEDVTMQDINVFSDEDTARKHLKKTNADFKDATNDIRGGRKQIKKDIAESGQELSQQEQRMVNAAMGFAGNLLESQSTILEDSVVTTSITFGKKQMKTLTMLMNFAKAMEKKEEEKEKKENEDEVK